MANKASKKGNHQKYESYSEAWKRIQSAQSDGYYLEAITLEESIISDRLLSFVAGAGEKRIPISTPFAELIKKANRILDEMDDSAACKDLLKDLDQWRKARNKLIHGFVKSEPGTPTDFVEVTLALAKEASHKGASLARSICTWHAKQLRNVRNAAQQ